jgi:DNA-binding NarL/FixJ family response regulator
VAAREVTDATPPARSVLIVDDHPSFRAAARLMLERAGYDIVGESGDAASALAAAHRLRPAVVLLDVGLPDRDGFDVAEELCRGDAPPQVVLVSARGAAPYRRRLETSPARGFIAKRDLSPATFRSLVADG